MRIVGKYPQVRLRRVRNSNAIRRLVSQNDLSANDLILPIFIRNGKKKVEKIKTMPGVYRYSIDKLIPYVEKLVGYGILAVALFPLTPIQKKSSTCEEAWNPENLVNIATRQYFILPYLTLYYPILSFYLDVAQPRT